MPLLTAADNGRSGVSDPRLHDRVTEPATHHCGGDATDCSPNGVARAAVLTAAAGPNYNFGL